MDHDKDEGESSQKSNKKNTTNHRKDATQELEDKYSVNESEVLKEVTIQSIDLNVATCSTEPMKPLSIISKVSALEDDTFKDDRINAATTKIPIIVIQCPSNDRPVIKSQPEANISGLTSTVSAKSLVVQPNNPPTLFVQAINKLNESSVSLAVLNQMKRLADEAVARTANKSNAPTKELSPPDSLTSAPPSYSFVLRQSARRRPRLMGTFIPSPSFVQHTPPPNYAAAFDIYVDNPVPPQPARMYSFGFTSMPAVCPECGYVGLTVTRSKITFCTHLCALSLCLFFCWICAPLPYMMRTCKDVYHYCRNCRYYLGMYSPSNPDAPFQ